MTYICSIVITNGLLKEDEEFPNESDDILFEELHQLYSSNHEIITEFAVYINNTILFPDNVKEQYLISKSIKKRPNKNEDSLSLSLKDF